MSPLACKGIHISQRGDLSDTYRTFPMHQSSFSEIMTEECAGGQTLVKLGEIFLRFRQRIKFLLAS